MNEILIIGSTGRVGRMLVEELVKSGERVRAATRNPQQMAPGERVTPVKFDYHDPSTFAAALDGADRVFVLEPQPPSDTPSEALIIPFLEAGGKRKVVLMSSASVDFGDIDPLLKVEQALKTPFVILRPNWFMDNFHTMWLAPILEQGVIPLPAAESRTAFVDARDIAACAAVALTTDRFDGGTFTLSGPESLTYSEAATVLSQAAGRAIQYVPVDDESFTQTLIDIGMPPRYSNYVTELFRWTRKGAAANCTTAVQEITGRPPHTLAEYAQVWATIVGTDDLDNRTGSRVVPPLHRS